MRKIKSLLNGNSSQTNKQFDTLVAQANSHLNLRQFWEAVAPKILSQSSFAGSLNNGQLTIYADNASVAAKIKLTSTSLLTQLQNLQKNDPFYKLCKVTAIKVKMQVKSRPKAPAKAPRILSPHAAKSLKNLAKQLGDSALATKLTQLANRN